MPLTMISWITLSVIGLRNPLLPQRMLGSIIRGCTSTTRARNKTHIGAMGRRLCGDWGESRAVLTLMVCSLRRGCVGDFSSCCRRSGLWIYFCKMIRPRSWISIDLILSEYKFSKFHINQLKLYRYSPLTEDKPEYIPNKWVVHQSSPPLSASTIPAIQ